MSAQHTTGPWIYAIPGDSFVASDSGLICRRPAVSGGGSAPSNWEANARLIAAAPDLLDALQYLAAEFRSVVNSEFATHRCPDPAKDDPAYLKAMAAITKAIG